MKTKRIESLDALLEESVNVILLKNKIRGGLDIKKSNFSKRVHSGV